MSHKIYEKPNESTQVYNQERRKHISMHKLAIIAHNNNPNIYQWIKAKCGLCMHTHTHNVMPSNIDACHTQ